MNSQLHAALISPFSMLGYATLASISVMAAVLTQLPK